MNRTEEFRKEVVSKFIELLEEKGLSWNQGWKDAEIDIGEPISASTNQIYRGMNRFHLFMESLRCGYDDNRWATFYQIKENGWKLNDAKGRGVKIEYWFPYDVDEKKSITWKELERIGETIGGRYQLRATYATVFNGSLIEGIEKPEHLNIELNDVELNEVVEVISNNMDVEILNDGGNRAYYSRLEDKIHVPLSGYFDNEYEYNATVLHELSHATGSSNRLNRTKGERFGDDNYAYEELVAEISSCFTSFEVGLKPSEYHIQNHGAYVKSWINQLKEKPEVLANAVADAEKASSYLMKQLDIEVEVSKTLNVDIGDTEIKIEKDLNQSLHKRMQLRKSRSL